MDTVSLERALELIKDMGISAIIEYESLSYLMGGKDAVECYDNTELLVIIDHCEDDNCDYVTAIPYNESFDINDFKRVISEHCANPVLSINIQKLSPQFQEQFASEIIELIGPETTVYLDYVFMDMKGPASLPDGIRMLEESDKENCVEFFVEQMRYRPPFSLLFDIFVSKKRGYILGAFDGSQPVGYLSFVEVTPDVFDVDFVYVIPNRRKEGWGKKLADAYVYFAESKNHVAYWSSAKNDASVKTAESSGLKLIRVAKKYSKT